MLSGETCSIGVADLNHSSCTFSFIATVRTGMPRCNARSSSRTVAFERRNLPLFLRLLFASREKTMYHLILPTIK